MSRVDGVASGEQPVLLQLFQEGHELVCFGVGKPGTNLEVVDEARRVMFAAPR